ncbi:MAG: hypothetical protein KDB26_11795 [Microthrixaceae bacterium]|nr:hypothetical protein [Microthrixaceae bacterium]
MPITSVVPDVPAVDRPFDYLTDVELPIGTVVRVPFGGRRVRGWVVEPDGTPDPDRELLAITKVVGIGPDASVVALCRWAAWRWSGRFVSMLRVATPDRPVRSLPRAIGTHRERGGGAGSGLDEMGGSPAGALAESVLRSTGDAVVMRTSPVSDQADIAIAAASTGQAIVVTPSPIEADRITRRLSTAGHRVARWPYDWAQAATGATVVGTRGAVFAPAPDLSAIVVLDEHDERLQSESSPTWNAREVAVERARRHGVPCALVSPCPSLDAYVAQIGNAALAREASPVELVSPAVSLSASELRAGWAPTIVIDRRGEDTGRTGLFSSELVELMRGAIGEERPVTCVLNRTGRSRLLACRSCSSIARCHSCDGAVHLPDPTQLCCGRCGATRPPVCAECGSTALALLRPGVSRAREELEALLRTPVVEVTAATRGQADTSAGVPAVAIGTTAILGRSIPGGLVAFLDFDQELLSPRYRGAEDALTLLVQASRIVGGRSLGGSVVLQTRLPEHEVVAAALRSDSSLVSLDEVERRRMLGLPPFASIALLGLEAAPEFVERLGKPEGVSVSSGGDGSWLVKSSKPGRLQEALAATERPPGRLRLQVDPHRIGR